MNSYQIENGGTAKLLRIKAIDVMRGLTLFLMLFVNDLYIPGVPKWLVHTQANEDGMGLADWVFPGFLFMVGLAIPFAYAIRKSNGSSDLTILRHTLIRSVSLIFIGVLMVNISRLNPELTGMSKFVWAISIYLCIFLIWNDYALTIEKIRKNALILKIAGSVGILILVLKFRSGSAENPSWLIASWWGILGLIGWGYLVAYLVYLRIKNNLLISLLIWMFFIALNAASLSGYTAFADSIKPIFGVILNGNTPSVVLAGLFAGILLQKYGENNLRVVKLFFVIGILCITFGFLLRHWYIISKIIATPSWAMICNGISFIIFGSLYFILDHIGNERWSNIFKTAGQNSFTTYLVPDVLYYIIWTVNVPILIYKQSAHMWIVAGGSILWAYLMISFPNRLSKYGIKLRL